ncbi:myelin regulatory factor-like protein [Morone saxatilis]|uniref:myelin regulatory factor-like protein n=1 Tax=Morone saxatilis TaxID=34816 RepID=UPI0015E1C33D|nr:myelin regulatory factor-like protein [Morone saxatilis]
MTHHNSCYNPKSLTFLYKDIHSFFSCTNTNEIPAAPTAALPVSPQVSRGPHRPEHIRAQTRPKSQPGKRSSEPYTFENEHSSFTDSHSERRLEEAGGGWRRLEEDGGGTNTTIQSFMIKENQQVIDRKYCLRDECGPGRFAYRVPISPFVPVNMRVTLIMNSTELLVVHLCSFDESASCSALLDINTVTGTSYPSNTQGEHEWPLHVSRLYHSSYHFRSTVAGQADCSTDHHFAGALFTDYHFHFYRRCTDS